MTGKDVTTTLEYQEKTFNRPFFYARPKTDDDNHKEIRSVNLKSVEVDVKDGRGLGLNLDGNSFELFDHVTSMTTSDFYNESKVKSIYYDEIKEFLKNVTGASHVIIFHHQVRNVAKVDTDDPTVINSAVQKYAHVIHTDASRYTSENLFRMLNKDPEYQEGRFMYLNVWRNISDSSPIINDPLTVLDQTSIVAPDDYIEFEFYGATDSLQYRLNPVNAYQHRWYYFSEMKKNEALVFKQYDSDITRKSRTCFHTAFSNPLADKYSPTRESIEVRALCFFPEHKPNTCPQVTESTLKNDPVEEGVGRVMKAVSNFSVWPHKALLWVKFELSKGRRGVRNIATTLTKDENGYLSLKDLPKETKEKIVNKLMEESSFEALLRSNFEKVRHRVGFSNVLVSVRTTFFISVMAAGLGFGLSVLLKKKVWNFPPLWKF